MPPSGAMHSTDKAKEDSHDVTNVSLKPILRHVIKKVKVPPKVVMMEAMIRIFCANFGMSVL